MASDLDRVHMRRAIALALPRMGATWPNPTVGCVIARAETVVGEAATGPGGPNSSGARMHAEEQALAAAGPAARAASAYVTLEPCDKRSSERPSCTDRLIEAGVLRVVVACRDPSPNAAGMGLERLRAAGVAVEPDLLDDEAELLYRGYRRRLATGRPLIEAARDGEGFDAEFKPDPGEELRHAITRFGTIGYTRMWVKRGGLLESALLARSLLN
jgi:diaminohydroxyphosphoribosylaminopyrimidine deaminase / 5-amino-6-(5-phosphoribosylamino)uracil reductase